MKKIFDMVMGEKITEKIFRVPGTCRNDSYDLHNKSQMLQQLSTKAPGGLAHQEFLSHPTGVRKVVGLIPTGNSQFSVVP